MQFISKIKYTLLFLIPSLFCLFSAAGQSTQGRLQINANRILGGDTVSMVYRVDTTIFKPGQPTFLRTYIYDTSYHWTFAEVQLPKMQKSAGSLSIYFTYPVPKDAGLIALAITNQDASQVDNNQDQGYFIMAASTNNRFAAGAEAGYGLLRAPYYGYGVPEYYNKFSISDTAFYMWLNNEILRHHGSAAKLVLPYAAAIAAYKKEAAQPELRRAVNFLTGKVPGVSNYYKAWEIALKYLRNTSLADTVIKAARDNSADSLIQQKQAYQHLQSIRQPREVITAAKAFLKTFPYHREDIDTYKMLNINYVFVYRQLAACYLALQEKDSALALVNQAPFDNLPELFYKLVEIPYDDWKTLPADSALLYSQPIFDRWQYFSANKPPEYWYMSDGQWASFVDRLTKHNRVIQSRILLENNHLAEALKMSEQAQKEQQYHSADLNQTQATLYEQLKNKDALHHVLVESVKHNQATSNILDQLEKEYIAKKKTAHGFDDYVESLKDAHTMQLLREEVGKSAVNIPAVPFSLKNQYGKTISLDSLKGKIVVLDFWATWCAPCKASFPGMNMAKTYFKKNKNVRFFFVDTQERIKGYVKQTVAYTKAKGFDFEILYDTTSDVYGHYSSLIHTSGIPFKIIIDGNGQIRNFNVGYKGSPSGLKDEIVEMVKAAMEH